MKKNLTVLPFAIIALLFAIGCDKNDIKPGDSNPDNTSTVIDNDGNTCKTIIIFEKTWMAENLNVLTYNDGTTIPTITDVDTWQNLTSGAVCTYNNTTNSDTLKKYGRLYNWYAVNTGKLCPIGWHVSTETDWNDLVDSLLNNGSGYESVKSMGKAIASNSSWELSNNDANGGNVGYDQTTNNSTGFNAYPSGFRSSNAIFAYDGTDAYWWTTREENLMTARDVNLYYNSSNIGTRNSNQKSTGMAVRCVKD